MSAINPNPTWRPEVHRAWMQFVRSLREHHLVAACVVGGESNGEPETILLGHVGTDPSEGATVGLPRVLKLFEIGQTLCQRAIAGGPLQIIESQPEPIG